MVCLLQVLQTRESNLLNTSVSSTVSLIHNSTAACVAWVSNDEVISAGDDHEMKLWRLSKDQPSTFLTLPGGLFPLAIAACPPKMAAVGLNKSGAINILAVSSTNGLLSVEILTP